MTAKLARKRIEVCQKVIARLSAQADQHDAEGAEANVHAARTAVDDDVLTRLLADVKRYEASADTDDEDGRMNLLADAGYCSDDKVQACEEADVKAYIATGKNGRAKPPKGSYSQAVETMVERMQDMVGQVLYRKRKSAVETTFGCIKDAMGFRNPKMRGLAGVQTEWQLACLAWNIKRLYSLGRASLF